MPTARTPRTDFARRVDLYALAALPADQCFEHTSITAGAIYEYGLDHLETRNRAEAEAVERIVREAGL
jgi:hypothetical protein